MYRKNSATSRLLPTPGSPVVLVVEDLHWADDALLGFVEHLVDWSTGVPILLVCTARPELYERHHGWGGGKRNSTTIGLSPLSEEETARLIAALLDQAVLPAETQSALLDRAGGNPLYTEEFVRMLVDRGLLEHRGASWTIAEGAEIPVPENVQAIIAARLDTLSPERKALLHDASVVGKTFWSGALTAMGPADEREVRESLHELARKELVRAVRRSSVEGQAEYSFWHLLVRDVAYGQIPRSARANKHVAAAGWIEAMVGERVPDHAELIAHHYLQALALSSTSATPIDADSLQARAARFLMMAGDRATALDFGKAYEHYSRALGLIGADDADRPRLLVKLCEATQLTGRLDDSVKFGEEAVEGFRRRGELVAAGDAMTSLQRAVWYRGDTAHAMSIAREAVDLLEREPPGPALGKAYGILASRLAIAGNPTESFHFAEKAIPICREFGLTASLSRALGFRGWSGFFLGLGDGLDDNREAARLALESDDPSAPVALVNLAGLLWEVEGPGPALEQYEQAIAFSQRRGLAGMASWAKAETTWVLYDLGRWDELREAAQEVISASAERSQVNFVCLPFVAFTKVWRGELDEAAAMAEEFLPTCREIHDPQILLPALEAAALVARRREDTRGAVELVEEYERETEGRPMWRSMYLPTFLRILAAEGRHDVADRLIEGTAEWGARRASGMTSVRAIVAEGKGELEEAQTLYEEAAEKWRAFGHVLERGQALLGAGRCLAQLGRSQEAVDRLRTARELFASLGATPLVAEADDWLERATALTS